LTQGNGFDKIQATQGKDNKNMKTTNKEIVNAYVDIANSIYIELTQNKDPNKREFPNGEGVYEAEAKTAASMADSIILALYGKRVIDAKVEDPE
jgi:hypothetical protein